MITYSSGQVGYAGKNLSVQPITRPLRIPVGTVIRGVNTTSYGSTVQQQWSTSWSWPFMKQQIDNTVALGGNCIRISGAVAAVVNGLINLSDYLAHWTQVLDYVASVGLLAYPCAGGAPSSWLGDNTVIGQANAVFGPWAALVNTYSNVIGIDVLNEPFAQFGAQVSPDLICVMLASFATTVRANTSLATTFDRVVFRASQLTKVSGDVGRYLDPLIDFVDLHVYYSTPTLIPDAADTAAYLKTPEGQKPIIIGEFGANMTNDSATRAAIYTGVKNMIVGNPRIVGGLAWAAVDTDDTTANQWGLFATGSTVERTDISSVFRTFPVTR